MKHKNIMRFGIILVYLGFIVKVVKLMGSNHPMLACTVVKLLYDAADNVVDSMDDGSISQELDDILYEVSEGKTGKKMEVKETNDKKEFGFH